MKEKADAAIAQELSARGAYALRIAVMACDLNSSKAINARLMLFGAAKSLSSKYH